MGTTWIGLSLKYRAWKNMILRILAWVFMPEDRKRGISGEVIKVKSWKPFWGDYGLEWPCMLIQRHGHQRQNISPCIWSYVRYYWERAFKDAK